MPRAFRAATATLVSAWVFWAMAFPSMSVMVEMMSVAQDLLKAQTLGFESLRAVGGGDLFQRQQLHGHDREGFGNLESVPALQFPIARIGNDHGQHLNAAFLREGDDAGIEAVLRTARTIRGDGHVI